MTGPGSVLGEEITLARAAAAARRSDLDEARRLLADGGSDPSPARLDLLARVHAQQGRLVEADACWAQVQATEPGNADAEAGRARIVAITSGRARSRPLITLGRVLGIAVLVLLAGAGLVTWRTFTIDAPAATATAAPPPQEATGATATAVPAPPEATDPDPPAPLQSLADALRTPGARVTAHPESVEAMFDGGVFARSDRLSTPGSATLTAFGRALRGRDVTVTVVGHAATVAGGPTAGGSVVALARALVAAQEIARSSGLPLTAFSLATGDQTENPFPDAARNRTVTVTVTPKPL